MPSSMAGVILEETIDENYEPTEEEVVEYARWLGMELPQEEELLWIAREGVKAVLPENWRPCRSDDGDIYFFNFKTGESVWDHPCDEYYRSLYMEERRKLTEEREEAEYQETQSLGYQSSTFSPQMPPAVVVGSHAELLGFGPVKSLDSLRRKPLPALSDRGKSVDLGLAATVPASSLSHGAARSTAEATAAISLPASPAAGTDSSIFSRGKGSDATADSGVDPHMTSGKEGGGDWGTMVRVSGRRFRDPMQYPPTGSDSHAELGGKPWQTHHHTGGPTVRMDRSFSEREAGEPEREPGPTRHTRDGSGTASTSTTTGKESDRSGVRLRAFDGSSGGGAVGVQRGGERREISVQSGPSPSSDSKRQYYGGRTFTKKRGANVVRLTAGDVRGGMHTVGPGLGRTGIGQPGVFWQSDTDSGDSSMLRTTAPVECVKMEAATDKRGQPLDGRKATGAQTVQPTDQQLEMVRRWKEQDQKESAALQAMGDTMDPVQLQQQLLLQMFQKQSTEEHGLYLRQRQDMEVRVMERLKDEERDLTKKLRAALNQRIEKEVQKEEEKLKSLKVASMQAKLSQEAEDIHSKIWEDLEARRQQRVNAMEAEAQQLEEDEKHLNELRQKVESAARKLNEDEQVVERRAAKCAENREALLQEERMGVEEVVRRKVEEMEREMLKQMTERLQERIQREEEARFQKAKEEIEAEHREMMKKAQQELRAEAETALVQQFKSMEMRTGPAGGVEGGLAGGHGESGSRGHSQATQADKEEHRNEEMAKMKARISTQVEEEERSLIEEKRKEASERVAAMLKDMEHQRGEIATQIEAKLETERKRMEEEMNDRLLMIGKAMKAEETRWIDKQRSQKQEREKMEAEARALFEKYDEASIREQIDSELRLSWSKEIRKELEESLRMQVEEEVRQSLRTELQEGLRKDMEFQKKVKMEEAEQEVNAEVEKWRKDRVKENMGTAIKGVKQAREGETAAKEEQKGCGASLSKERKPKDLHGTKENASLAIVHMSEVKNPSLGGERGDESEASAGGSESVMGAEVVAVVPAVIIKSGSGSHESSELRQDLGRQLVLEVSNAKRDLEQQADRVRRETEEERLRRDILLKEELTQLVDGKQNAILRRLNLDSDPIRGGKSLKQWDPASRHHSKRNVGTESRSLRQLERDKKKTESGAINRREPSNNSPAPVENNQDCKRGVGKEEHSGRSIEKEWNLVERVSTGALSSEMGSWDDVGRSQFDVSKEKRGLGSEDAGNSGSDWWAARNAPGSESKVWPGDVHGNPSSRDLPPSGGRSRMRRPPALATVRAECSSEDDADDERLPMTQNKERGVSARSGDSTGALREPFAKWENVMRESAADREGRLVTAYLRREHMRLKEVKKALHREQETWGIQLQAYRKITDRSHKEERKYTLQEAKLEIENRTRTHHARMQEVRAFEHLFGRDHEEMNTLGGEMFDHSSGLGMAKIKARPTLSAPVSPVGRIECGSPDSFKGWATIYGSDVSRVHLLAPRGQDILVSPSAQQTQILVSPSLRQGQILVSPSTQQQSNGYRRQSPRDPHIRMDRSHGSHTESLLWSPRGVPLPSPSLDRKVRNGSMEQREMLANLAYGQQQPAAQQLLTQHSRWMDNHRHELSAAGLSLRQPTLRQQEAVNHSQFIRL